MTSQALQFIQHIMTHGVTDQATTHAKLEDCVRAITEQNQKLRLKKEKFLRDKTAHLQQLEADIKAKKAEMRLLKEQTNLVYQDFILFGVN